MLAWLRPRKATRLFANAYVICTVISRRIYMMPLTGSAVVAVGIAGFVRYRHLLAAWLRGRRSAIALKDRFLLVLLTAAFWLAFVLYPEPCPRNAAMITFPMAVFAGVLLARRRAGHLLALCLVAGGPTLSELDLPALPPDVSRRSSDLLERNLAFVEDLYANQDACDFMARNADGNTMIYAQWPFWQMLSIPELGYVRSPLRRIAPPGHDGPEEGVYIFTENHFPGNRPPGTGDRILYWNSIHNQAPVYIYRKKAPPSSPENL